MERTRNTMREIGSDFWADITTEKQAFQMPGINMKISSDYFVSGRSAIRALARGLNVNKKILLPAYTCETVIIPFEKERWEIMYYSIDTHFKIDGRDLLQKIDEFAPSAILVQNYFGFHTLADFDYIRDICIKKGVLVVEDLTQCLLSEFDKTKADYYVSSLRKFFAIPEGGILATSRKNLFYKMNAETNIYSLAMEAFELKNKYINFAADVSKECFFNKYTEWKNKLSSYDEIYQMGQQSKELLETIDLKIIKKKRKKNFEFLLEGLSNVKWLKICFDTPTDDEIPLYFPIYVKESSKRKEVQKYMAEQNIYCPIVWPRYMNLEMIDKSSDYIYEHILCIPCDQRYGKEDMKKITETFLNFNMVNCL